MGITASNIADLFGGARSLGHAVASSDDVRRLVARGIPADAYRQLLSAVATTPDRLAAVQDVVFHAKTRARRGLRGDASLLLTVEESERAERIARFFADAVRIIGDDEQARIFLFSPHPTFDGDAPIRWLATEVASRDVAQVLANIEYSLPA